MALVSRLDPWAPPLALMGLIFFLSHQPDLSTGLGTWDLIGRKIVHAGTYALLCFLWWRALQTALAPDPALWGAAAISFVYALTDEIHQSFIDGRHGSAVDVAIDAIGIAAAVLFLRGRAR